MIESVANLGNIAHALAAQVGEASTPNMLWRRAQIGRYGLTNFKADVLLDADGDGVPSGDEWVMNTDPTNDLSFLYAARYEVTYGTNCWDVVSTNSVPPYDVTTQIVCNVIGQWLSLTNALSPEALKMYRPKVRVP
ncbi:MAG: hypothetical protein V2A34_00055 [Lentisphaerota bacterium]